MIPNGDRADNLSARTNINVSADFNAGNDGDLLQDQAIAADLSMRMNHNPIRMGKQQTTSNLAIYGNVGSGHNHPKVVLENSQF